MELLRHCQTVEERIEIESAPGKNCQIYAQILQQRHRLCGRQTAKDAF